MNERFLKATGISLAGFFVLVAVNGRAFFDALAGFPLLVSAWSHALPYGAWSALLALVVAMGAWAFAMRYLHPRPDGQAPQLGADVVAVLTGVAVTMSQASGGGASALLQALWMGCAAGFLAPVLSRAVASVAARVRRP